MPAGGATAVGPRVDIDAFVAKAAQRFGLPETWIYAVIRAESAGRIHAVSSAGAMGLMQLMPPTWARQRARFALGSDPFEPRDNILAGASYLREMYDRYGPTGFLAAYNAGPGRYEDWRAGRRALPRETIDYVAKLASAMQSPGLRLAVRPQGGGNPAALLPAPDRLFVGASEPRSADGAEPLSTSRHDLFVVSITVDRP